MNPHSLCAKCTHLITPKHSKYHECTHRNHINRNHNIVCIEKGFNTCINFKPRKEQKNS